MSTTFEQIGNLEMGIGPNPTGTLFIPIRMMIEGDRVIGYSKTLDEQGNEIFELKQIGTVKLTATGKSYNLNVFGSTVIVNKIALDELKSKKPGAIKSVSAAVPIENNNMPVGVKSGILANSTAY